MLSMQRVRRPAQEACSPAFAVLLLFALFSLASLSHMSQLQGVSTARVKAFT
jgi:hypothetical protein